MKLLLGIDFGGTKTSVGVFGYDGDLLAQGSSINPKTDDPEVLWDSFIGTVDEVASGYLDDIVVCGVGAAGPMTAKGKTISPANAQAWKQFPLRERLEGHIKKPAYIENDCKALALGEGWKGAAVGEQNYMSMVVSTGIGGGVVLDGRLLHGHEMQAGHIGHTMIEPGGRSCGCGSRGCVESYASGPSLKDIFGVDPENATDEMKHYCADKVAQAVATVSCLLDIRLVTIGGSVALGFGDPFFSHLQGRLDEWVKLEFAQGIKAVPSGLGVHGGLISAARVGKLGYRGVLWNN